MGSNLDRIKELCYELNEVLPLLEKELEKLQDLMDKEQFGKIFLLIDKKQELFEELKKLLEIEKVIPKDLDNIKNQTLRKTLEVNKKELDFHKEKKKRIKDIMMQIKQKDNINSNYLKKVTNSYFIDKKIT